VNKRQYGAPLTLTRSKLAATAFQVTVARSFPPRRTPASPITDFAYVVNTSKGDYLNLIIETKNVDGKRELRHEEHDKIKHAQKLFEQISKSIKITFMTQFSGDKIHDLIKKLAQ
jgi:restriction endonuclease